MASLGLPPPENDITTVTPKEYINLFRSLYISSYLRRPFSEFALSLLLHTEFTSQIPAGLPPDVKVAHKVGINREEKIFHDCGIIYLPKKNYLLCMMSKNSTQEESDRVMSAVSRTIYDYLSREK
ncbi:MAG: serine hydrolase [Nanoarchaeota archaeon]